MRLTSYQEAPHSRRACVNGSIFPLLRQPWSPGGFLKLPGRETGSVEKSPGPRVGGGILHSGHPMTAEFPAWPKSLSVIVTMKPITGTSARWYSEHACSPPWPATFRRRNDGASGGDPGFLGAAGAAEKSARCPMRVASQPEPEEGELE